MTNTAPLADAYAALKHEEAAIAARLTAMKAEILNTGETEIVGDTCILAVVEKKGATTLDKDATLALLRRLGVSEEDIKALHKTGKASPSLMLKPKLAMAV